ncbi:MAG: hypothetical protein ABSE86_17575 [Bryobacteraceae bacterium]|jgi:hypothetical protein
MRKFLTLLPSLAAAAVATTLTSMPLRADLTEFDIDRNILYSQTSGSAPTTPVGYFFDSRGDLANAGDFDGGTLTLPPASTLGSPQSYTLVNPTLLNFETGFLDLGTLNAEFPFGTYTINATNSGTSASESASINYTQDAFTADVPALTPTTFNGLNGLNTANPFTVNFNSFTPNGAATVGFTFFSITDVGTGTTIVSDSFLSPTTASALLAANTLAPGTQYSYELDFSDRIQGTDPLNGVPTNQLFDVRTDGTFTTGSAVPEPSGTAFACLALLAVAGFARRKRFI